MMIETSTYFIPIILTHEIPAFLSIRTLNLPTSAKTSVVHIVNSCLACSSPSERCEDVDLRFGDPADSDRGPHETRHFFELIHVLYAPSFLSVEHTVGSEFIQEDS